MTNEDNLSMLSALLDGELPPAEAAREAERIARDPDRRDTWRRYQTISDVLKGELPERMRTDFSRRVSTAIDAEPAILAPRSTVPRSFTAPLVGAALAASIAMVAVIGVRPGEGDKPAAVAAQPSIAQIDTQVTRFVAPDEQPTPARNDVWRAQSHPAVTPQSRLDSYIVSYSEHRGMTGTPAMLPYVKVVGYQQGR